MRAVLDTNILISGFISDKGIPFNLLDLWLEDHFELVTSYWQIAEFRRVSRYDHVKNKIEPALIGRFVNLL